MNFATISDFKWCMKSGGEVQFIWGNKTYGIIHITEGIVISEIYNEQSEKICKDTNEVLEYMIDGQRLREIITQVKVWDRTIQTKNCSLN